MIKAFLARKKASRPFRDYHAEWFHALKTTHLPLLREAMSSSRLMPTLLAYHVETLHLHFRSYYDALDLAASDDVAQLLFPDWRNPLEKPFLWLGDFHPYLFINLLRSFLDEDNDEEEEDDDEEEIKIGYEREFFDKPWQIMTAWRNPSKSFMSKVDQIECGLRLMVPSLVNRAKLAQIGFVDRLGANWGNREGGKERAKMAVGEAVNAQMEEMVNVLEDANRLRRSVLAEIMGAMNVYQAAQFLEALAQFLVGFKDSNLLDERCL